ncbi:phasin family protein [Paraburkholderia azotifigens]|uniref:Phasin family protein n=1 Tax=Paraburkholderia azotifigens TaxID=2057004 RepID=A0A5C6VLN0_9BURK|nr:phasin family protein [Paraburkholderia azotifigens]TXC84445.1 hypothetical protein FRZ40_29640 [Paraburkholderia azotifigens]
MNTLPSEPFAADTMQAVALANTEALTKWIALCEEAWMRAATVRNPLEYAAIGSLMLPACASQAMLYCKRIADIAAGAQTAASQPLTAVQTGKPAADIGLSMNAPSRPAVTASPDVTHAPTPTGGAVKQSPKQSIPVPPLRGE